MVLPKYALLVRPSLVAARAVPGCSWNLFCNNLPFLPYSLRASLSFSFSARSDNQKVRSDLTASQPAAYAPGMLANIFQASMTLSSNPPSLFLLSLF
jgi:hypothetical protein